MEPLYTETEAFKSFRESLKRTMELNAFVDSLKCMNKPSLLSESTKRLIESMQRMKKEMETIQASSQYSVRHRKQLLEEARVALEWLQANR